MRRRFIWFTLISLVILGPLAFDWLTAQARLDRVTFDYTLSPAQVVADGKSSTTITLRVTEDGQPRANDMFQIWFEVGGGLLTPDTAFTDSNGLIKITYRPNPANPYDPTDFTQIAVMDASIGRLIEVRKQQSIKIPLVIPQ
jgi:hypothetical protein